MDTFDICVSTAVLEHIPKTDIIAILKELKRILKPGNIVSATIGYFDHYAHNDPRITRLNHLRFSDVEWKKQPRESLPKPSPTMHYHEIFARLGFQVIEEHTRRYCELSPADILPELLTGSPTDYAGGGQWKLANAS